MGAVRAALELGVGLGADEERVVGQLDELHQVIVGRGAGAHEPGVLELGAVLVVDLVTVPVPLVDEVFAVGLLDDRARQELGRVDAQPHRAALVDDIALLVHEVDHRMRSAGVELARVGAREPAHVTCELDHRALHAEAQAEERYPLLPGEAGGGDLALDAADAEASGDHDAVEPAQATLGEEAFGVVGRDPVDLDLRADLEAAVLERFDHREVGVGEVDVLADEPDTHRLGGGFDTRHERAPLVEIRFVVGEIQHAAHVVIEAFVVEDERDLVQRGGVDVGDDAFLGHVAQLRYLRLQPQRDRPVGAADDRIGLDATAAQLGDGVLRGLGLLLARGADEGHERDVHVEDVLASDVLAELPDRLEEREGSRCHRRCRRSR